MPRTEVYQLRLSRSEKDELAQRARLQGTSIAKLIRQKLGLDASSDPMKVAMTEAKQFLLLVAQHKRFMSTRKAEAKARKELERNPS